VTDFSAMLSNLSDQKLVHGRHLKRILGKVQDADLLDAILSEYLTLSAAQTAAVNYTKLDVEQIEVPTSGATVSMAAGTSVLILNPAAALAALTINLSDAPTHSKRTIELLSTRAITSLTMAAGSATVRAPLTTIAANGFARWRWVASDTTWLRCG